MKVKVEKIVEYSVEGETDYIEAIRTDLPEGTEVIVFQPKPIETAPKDPDRLLMLYVDGYWHLGGWELNADMVEPVPCWVDDSGDTIQPTHWANPEELRL